MTAITMYESKSISGQVGRSAVFSWPQCAFQVACQSFREQHRAKDSFVCLLSVPVQTTTGLTFRGRSAAKPSEPAAIAMLPKAKNQRMTRCLSENGAAFANHRAAEPLAKRIEACFLEARAF